MLRTTDEDRGISVGLGAFTVSPCCIIHVTVVSQLQCGGGEKVAMGFGARIRGTCAFI